MKSLTPSSSNKPRSTLIPPSPMASPMRLSPRNPASALASSSAPHLPQFFFVDRSKSTLIEEESVQSRIPGNALSFLSPLLFPPTPSTAPLLTLPLFFSYLLLAAPLPGQRKLFTELRGKISPCLNPLAASLGFTSSYLLHGVNGSGKRSLVQSLASFFGVHFIDVRSLLDFLSPFVQLGPLCPSPLALFAFVPYSLINCG